MESEAEEPPELSGFTHHVAGERRIVIHNGKDGDAWIQIEERWGWGEEDAI